VVNVIARRPAVRPASGSAGGESGSTSGSVSRSTTGALDRAAAARSRWKRAAQTSADNVGDTPLRQATRSRYDTIGVGLQCKNIHIYPRIFCGEIFIF